jgi:hypothetical protein
LTEYILYREKIIQKLKEINRNNKEEDIHNLIVPMGKKYQKNESLSNIYQNNA